jgi:hypothetical protein
MKFAKIGQGEILMEGGITEILVDPFRQENDPTAWLQRVAGTRLLWVSKGVYESLLDGDTSEETWKTLSIREETS